MRRGGERWWWQGRIKQYLERKTLSFPLPIFGHYSNAFPQNQLWKLWILNLHHSATSHAIDTSHLLHLPGIMLWRNKLGKKLAFLHPISFSGRDLPKGNGQQRGFLLQVPRKAPSTSKLKVSVQRTPRWQKNTFMRNTFSSRPSYGT